MIPILLPILFALLRLWNSKFGFENYALFSLIRVIYFLKTSGFWKTTDFGVKKKTIEM